MSELRPRLRFLFTRAARGGLVGVIAGGAAVQFGWLECLPAFRSLIGSPGVMIFGGLVGLIPAVAVFVRLAQEVPGEMHLFALWDNSVYAWLLAPSLLIVVGAALLAPYALAAGCGFLACGAATGAVAFLVQAVCRDTPPPVPDVPAPADSQVAGARRTVLGLPARVWFVLLACALVGAAIRVSSRPAPEHRASGPSVAPLAPQRTFAGRVDDLVANPAGITAAELDGPTDGDVKKLAPLTDLTRLSLKRSRVTDAGLKELPLLTKLKSLDLFGCPVTDAGIKELSRLPALAELELGNTQVTDAGLKELARLPALTQLGLFGCGVTDAGLKELSRLPALTRLDLRFCRQVTDAGVEHIAALTNLTALRLAGPGLTDATTRTLGRFTRLAVLDLDGPQVTPAALQELRARLPGCVVNGAARSTPVPNVPVPIPNPPLRRNPWWQPAPYSPPPIPPAPPR